MTITIGQPRRDGKYPVTLTFAGAPNMFGGFYPDQVFRKLYTREQMLDAVAKHGTEQQKAKHLAITSATITIAVPPAT
jgi:hypothetical protein